MSTKYLGQPFDIHGGGLENQFPHHECEIAQAEAAAGKPFVSYWVHNNMVTVDGQKMGKSLGNFITLKQVFSDTGEPKHEKLLRKYDPLAVRQLILNSHYRSPIDFSDAALTAAQSGYDRITQCVQDVRRKTPKVSVSGVDSHVKNELGEFKKRFDAAMNDDLNTSVALAVIFDMVRFANQLLEKGDTTKDTLREVDTMFTWLGGEVLGIVKKEYPTAISKDELIVEADDIWILTEMRKIAKDNKDFGLADLIRDYLEASGRSIRDTTDGHYIVESKELTLSRSEYLEKNQTQGKADSSRKRMIEEFKKRYMK